AKSREHELQRRRSNQEFVPGEMGFNGLCAQQQSRAAHVSCGSIVLIKSPMRGLRLCILSGDQGMIVWWSIGAGVHVESHSHPNEQIVWMLKGKMEFRLGSEQRVCGQGDVVAP